MKIRLRFIILFAVLAAMAVGTAVYVSLEGNTYTEHLTFFVNNYLKEYFGKPKKIRRTVLLSKEQSKQRKKFCQMILDKHI